MEEEKKADYCSLHQHISNCPDPTLSGCCVFKKIPLGIRDVQGYGLIANASLAL